MWFIHQLQPDSSAYNIGALTRLVGNLDLAAFERSFTDIARRHETCARPSMCWMASRFRSSPLSRNWHVDVIDLQGLPESDRDVEAMRLVRAEARRPFDLRRGPLLRPTLYRLNQDTHLLFVVMHHIISDAWSMGILTRELMTLYNALVANQPATLPALEIQYADFAAWQRQRLTGETLASQID